MHAPFSHVRRDCVEQMIRDIGTWEIENLVSSFNVIQDWHKKVSPIRRLEYSKESMARLFRWRLYTSLSYSGRYKGMQEFY